MKRFLIVAALALCACSEAGTEPRFPDAHEADPADAAPVPDSRPRADAAPLADAPPADAADPPPKYPAEQTLSPITPSVARNIQAISLRADNLKDDVFAKVGDSITVATQFMACFPTAAADLGAFTADLQGTLDHFKLGMAAGGDPYTRVSLAAKVGASSPWVLAESPNPLEKEVSAISPRYAIVMFGSNDAAQSPTFLFTFAPTLLDIVDRLASQGIIPIMSTVPPNTQDATVGARVPRFNAVIRAIAQGRQLPLMDYGREMSKLDSFGLGGDGLHPNSFPGGGACKLTTDGLRFGYNMRNLLTLQSLDRVRSVVEGDPAPDPAAPQPAVRGEGTPAVPFEINSFPWSDLRDSSTSGSKLINMYAGACAATQNESGPEYYYRLVLPEARRIRAMVMDGNGVDIDLHLMSGTTTDKCVKRDDKEIVADLAAGTYYFVLDTFVPAASGMPQAGEYLFVVIEEPPA